MNFIRIHGDAQYVCYFKIKKQFPSQPKEPHSFVLMQQVAVARSAWLTCDPQQQPQQQHLFLFICYIHFYCIIL